MSTNYNNEEQILMVKKVDLETEIKKQQELFNEYYTQYNNNRNLLASSIQNQSVLKDQYTKIKTAYQQALDTLNKICDLCKEIMPQIKEYRETKKTNRVNIISDFLFTRRALSHMYRDYTDTTDLKDELITQKNDLIKCYNQYKDELNQIDQLLNSYHIEHKTMSHYLLDSQELMINIEKDFFKSKEDIESLYNFSEEVRIKLLEMILYYYKKRNEVYQEILSML